MNISLAIVNYIQSTKLNVYRKSSDSRYRYSILSVKARRHNEPCNARRLGASGGRGTVFEAC